MKRVIAILGLALIIALVLIVALVVTSKFDVVENVTGLTLTDQYELYYIVPPAQPVKTLPLACVRTDLIRLWPLPVVQPWFEDWWEQQQTSKGLQGFQPFRFLKIRWRA